MKYSTQQPKVAAATTPAFADPKFNLSQRAEGGECPCIHLPGTVCAADFDFFLFADGKGVAYEQGC